MTFERPGMSDDDFGELIDRMKVDPMLAKRELLERAAVPLRKLSNKIMSASFPALKSQHELDSVVSELWLRLSVALDGSDVQSVEHFFRLAAHKIRQILLDMIYQSRRRIEMHRSASGSDEAIDCCLLEEHTRNPERLHAWTVFHERVAHLPEAERSVFELHYYLDVSQADIAKMLELSPRSVSRLWVGAIEKLRVDCAQLIGKK